MLINGIEYELKPLEEGDEDLIEGKVGEYDHSVALPVPGAEEETLYFKITDGETREKALEKARPYLSQVLEMISKPKCKPIKDMIKAAYAA